ncbi:uncharacterized protein TNCV_4266351 [Trichonephila clavipes]|nr:uncharacterized protein TNCV_4266351 [Trichonephila clavipes]
MHPRRNKEKFQQLTEFERGKNIGLREGFSYHAIGACVQRNSSIVMRVLKQWTGEHRTKNWQWTTEGGVSARRSTPATHNGSPSRETVDCCVCNGLMSSEPGKLIGTKLPFQMNHASICETMMTAFVLDGMPVNAAFQSALSNDILA